MKLLVRCVIAPLIEFTRLWEQNEFGRRFVQVLVEILIVLHLLRILIGLHQSQFTAH